jgi:hypothetical protein
LIASGAGDVTAEGKILAAGHLLGGGGSGVQFCLNALEGVQGDDGVVVAFGQRHAPRLVLVVSSVDFVCEHIADALGVDIAV